MVPDGQKVRTDGMDGWSQNYIPPTSSWDNDREIKTMYHAKFMILRLTFESPPEPRFILFFKNTVDPDQI